MKVKHDVPVTSTGIRKHTEWGRCTVLKRTSESEMNESEKRDEEPRHSHKKPNENVGKEDNACECNVSKNKSRDLGAHARCTWVGGVGTNGM
jgi:hypothetical protein